MYMFNPTKVRTANMADLKSLPCPEPTDSWRPVPHFDVIETLGEEIARRGLRVRKSQMTVVDGALHPSPGVSVKVPGAKLFSSFDLEAEHGTFVPGAIPSLGVRNSTDKSYALTIVIGMRVMCCSNGVMYVSEGVKLSRKHTSRFALSTEVNRILDAYQQSLSGMSEMHEVLRGRKLRTTAAKALTVDLARAGAIPSSHILPVLTEMSRPRHPEHRGQSLWSLYMSVTEVSLKKMSPQRASEAYGPLNKTLQAAA